MNHRAAPRRWILTTLLGLLVPALPGGADFEASVRHLRRTVNSQRDGSHLARLFSLRQLGDPTLRPLFFKVAQHAEWQVQVHAILGLTEIDESRHIDPWLVTQVDEQAQQAVIANAIDMELIGPDDFRELLTSDALAPLTRLLLIAELLSEGEAFDTREVSKFAGSPQYRVAGLASLILAQRGDPAVFSAFSARLDTLPKRDRDRHHLWLLEAIRQYKVTALEPWVKQVASGADIDRDIAYWAVYTSLVISPATGLTLWNQRLGSSPSVRDQLRFGMLLLAAGADVPASAYDRLTADNELLQRMVDAGRAISNDADPALALMALLDLGHLKWAGWVMGVLKDLPDQQSRNVYAAIIDTVERDEPGQAERIARAITATIRLAEIDPESVYRRLREAKDDSVTQEVLLLGLFETRSPAAGEVAKGLRRIGAGRADTLALLLIARHAKSMSAEELGNLSRVAAGGGRVSEGLQVQAAWMYLRHRGEIDRALARIFEEDG